jgi:hypothetical protein
MDIYFEMKHLGTASSTDLCWIARWREAAGLSTPVRAFRSYRSVKVTAKESSIGRADVMVH